MGSRAFSVLIFGQWVKLGGQHQGQADRLQCQGDKPKSSLGLVSMNPRPKDYLTIGFFENFSFKFLFEEPQ